VDNIDRRKFLKSTAIGGIICLDFGEEILKRINKQ
jgi:hypothetical protein